MRRTSWIGRDGRGARRDRARRRHGRRVHGAAPAPARLVGHLGPLLRSWWHSAPSRHAALSSAYATLIAAATREHGILAGKAGADNLFRRGGFRVLHRTAASMDKGPAAAERVRGHHGVAFDPLTSGELAKAEPSDAGAGAIHWRDPWSAVDPGAVVRACADLLARFGGTVARGDAASLRAGPRGGWRIEEHPWIGARPCMPDRLPVVGRSDRSPGLWMNFGHGHQGFALGPATGRLLAEMMGGEPPVADPTPFRPGRD